MQQLIATHYSDMEAQQKQAIIDMEELAQLINFDNVAVTEQERAEAMEAEDVNVLTYGKEKINDILNDQLTQADLEKEKENAVAPTPEVGDYGYTELGQDAEEVVFDFVPEAEPEETPAEEAAPEEPTETSTDEGNVDEAEAEDDWSFIDSLDVGQSAASVTPEVQAAAQKMSEPVDKENTATTFKERREIKKRKKEEEKQRKAEEKRRLEQEKKERKERMKKLEEENKAAAATSFAPTSSKKAKPANPYTPTAQQILSPQNNPEQPAEQTKSAAPEVTITSSGGANGNAARPRTFIPRSYTPISVTPENVHDLIGDKKKDKKKK